MSKFKIPLILCLGLTLCLCGCYDLVEIENRGFVISIGVDKIVENNLPSFNVSMSFPDTVSLAKESGGDSEESKSVKTSKGKTMYSAMQQIDAYSAKKIFYGQSKMVVFGEECLKDEKLFKEAIDGLERNKEINRKIIILSADKAEDLLKSNISGEPMLGIFVSNFYRNNENKAVVTFKQDLEKLTNSLYSSGNGVIPYIKAVGEKDKELRFGGLSVIKNYKLTGGLNDIQTRGYMWVRGRCKSAVVVSDVLNAHVPLNVTGNKSKLKFSEDASGKIVCEVKISVKGTIEEFQAGREEISQDMLRKLEADYKKLIEKEVLDTAQIFQKIYGVDAYNFKEEIRKHANGIYERHKDNYDFSNVIIKPEVTVKITGTGTKK